MDTMMMMSDIEILKSLAKIIKDRLDYRGVNLSLEIIAKEICDYEVDSISDELVDDCVDGLYEKYSKSNLSKEIIDRVLLTKVSEFNFKLNHAELLAIVDTIDDMNLKISELYDGTTKVLLEYIADRERTNLKALESDFSDILTRVKESNTRLQNTHQTIVNDLTGVMEVSQNHYKSSL